jgi:threonine dehydrogenase-like Zn-dependent dehydrogenase
VCGLRPGDRVATNGSWGTLTDYVVARPENVLRFPRRLAYREGCLLEVLPGVMMAATRSGIERTSSVLVAGQGLSGLLITRAIALHGCRRLAVVDPHPDKLALARELGATETHLGTLEQAAEHLRASGDGFDVCVVATPGAGRIDEAAPLLRNRSRIVFYGGLAEAERIDLLQLHHRSITLIKEGERINGVLEARALWHEGLQLVLDGALPLRRLRTHVFPFAEAQRAFELRADPAAGAIHVVLESPWAAAEAAAETR